LRVEIIKAPAGIGKSSLTANSIANATRYPIEIYAPTHKLAIEWYKNIIKQNPTLKVSIIGGRSHLTINGQPLCKKAKLAQELSNAGLSVFPNLCLRQSGISQEPITCEYYNNCEYIGQFKPADVYIYTHSYLPLARTRLENWIPSIVIIDESFFQQFIQQVKLNAFQLLAENLPDDAVSLCKSVFDSINIGKSAYRVVNKAATDGTLRKAIKALQGIKAGIHPGLSERELKAKLINTAHTKPIVILLKTLLYDRKGQPVVYDAITNNIIINHRKKLLRFSEDTIIKCLDASASQIISNALFKNNIFREIYSPRKAFVTQCYSTRCSTTSLVPEQNNNPKCAKEAKKKLKDIQQLIFRKAENGRKVLVIGPQKIVGNQVQGITSKLKIPTHCDSVHFNGFRGVDRWKDFDVVIVIGRNEPSVKAAEDIARALFAYDFEPLNLVGEWTTEKRGYYTKEGNVGTEVIVHPDHRVQAIVNQLREEETLQAIDRLRLVHASETKEVIILSNIPLEIEVNELRNWNEIMYGSRIERAIALNNGLLPLASEWLATYYPELWSTHHHAAKNDVKRWLTSIKKSQNSNNNFISKMTLFKYKKKRQKTWSWCLSGENDITLVKARLTTLFSDEIAVKTI